MPRTGSRLTSASVGTVGPSEDESLGGAAAARRVAVGREAFKPYQPPAPTPPEPIIVVPESAKPAPDTATAASPGSAGGPGGPGGVGSAGPGAGGSGGAPGGTGSPGYAGGGLVGKDGGKADAGEFVLSKAAVKKYGVHTLEALNGGSARIMTRAEAKAHLNGPNTPDVAGTPDRPEYTGDVLP